LIRKGHARNIPIVHEFAVDSAPRVVWYRQPHETLKQYAAFELYRDMGESRGHRAVSMELGHRSSKVVEGWSVRNKWRARIQAYDEDMARAVSIAFHKQRLLAIERQAKLGAALQDAALEGIGGVDLTDISGSEVSRMAEVGVKIERLAFGDTTEDTNTSHKIEFVIGEMPPWAVGANQQPERGTPASPDARSLSARVHKQIEAEAVV
jgi:hypothetical protein